MERMKECTWCRQRKPPSAFSRHRLSPDGHAYQCKECNAKRAKIWRATASGIYTSIKAINKFQKRKNVDITREEFIFWYNQEPKFCVYCDLTEEEMIYIDDAFNNRSKRLTVDCIENGLGYIKGNLVLACRRCNAIKNDILTHDEMMYVGQHFIRPKWDAQIKKNHDRRKC